MIHEHYVTRTPKKEPNKLVAYTFQTSGKPYVPSPTHNYVLVSSEAHIKEICQAQAAQGLSVSEAYSDVSQLNE